MITQERVRELFLYKDGSLFCRVHRGNAGVGTVAGSHDSSGYLRVMVDGKSYKAHRLVFLYHHGYLPENDVDHIDKCKTNNRVENLREVSKSCNMINSAQRAFTSSGVKGLSLDKHNQKWRAHIATDGTTKYLGDHADFTEAVAHRLAAEQCLEWGDCDSRSPAYQFMKGLS
jgi:hypothetical protein